MSRTRTMLSVLFVLSISANLFFVVLGLYVLRQRGVRAGDDHWIARESLFQVSTPARGSIVMLGDSLTEYADWSELLHRPILNRGIGGDTTSGILKRLHTAITPCPGSVFLMAGYNDLFRDGAPADTVAENFNMIAHRIRESCPNTVLYIESILPVSPERANGIDLPSFNQRLEALADGKGVRFVDLYSHFQQKGYMNPELTSDGVHLNGSGYLVWSSVIAPLPPNNE